MRFSATIGLAGKTATGIEVPDGLSFSQKQWYVLPIEQAKKAETRERRLVKALAMLREGRKR